MPRGTLPRTGPQLYPYHPVQAFTTHDSMSTSANLRTHPSEINMADAASRPGATRASRGAAPRVTGTYKMLWIPDRMTAFMLHAPIAICRRPADTGCID